MVEYSDITDLSCQIEEVCRFCMPPEKNRILYETANFYVMVSLGPIVEGYLLLVSKKHFGACLQIPSELLPEYYQLKCDIKQILSDVYGCCIFYEHGKTGSCLSGGNDHLHCFHAHLHCIPTNVNLNKIVSKELPGRFFDNEDSCRSGLSGIDRYLYIEDERIATYHPEKKIRSQYLRYVLSKELGVEDRWDWIKVQNWPLIEKTITTLKPYFDELSKK